jgi:hypothetical protein
MKRTTRIIEAALAAGFVAVVFAAGYAWLAWGVTPGRIAAALDTLRGASEAETKAEATSVPDLASRYSDEALREKQRAVAALESQEAGLGLRLNDRRAELSRIESDAARMVRDLTARADTVARSEKAFADAKAAREKLVHSADFRRQVEMFSNLNSRDAARFLYGYDAPLALELLKALDADVRASIVAEIDRLDRAPENSGREPKAGALLKGLWPGETARNKR